ncbi:iron-containing alcohol dehydrogenase family protein [Clostridium estertheticum]|uniref:iron-containing alcohol dehydrogenase family protein n=1 Tax=Clostridium estertheticum TaxID=238834 RepID=UPI001C6F3790|nr:iron-containing alcohol dehydrogenase family protein [Clostridium estertheticum]MBW9151746.1 iron-containing alcohol dehydrogenase [Clostridium estertheticum]WLC85503.1 iron-containing alcohol dehydrogenase [Clostridium estertheticum]
MNFINYYMPTKIILDKEVILKNSNLFSSYGKKALIVTGKTSSIKNGSLKDVTNALEKEGIVYEVFNDVEENPSLETIEKISKLGRTQNSNFIIGIGGGSPIDSAKAAGVLINNPNATIHNLFDSPSLKSIPVIAVPTTAGTGTETTPYAILTDNKLKTKHGICQRVFPDYAMLDVKYLMSLPEKITINTSIDALSHLIEGYLSSKSNTMSDALAEKGLKLFGECLNMIKEKDFTCAVREKLMLASTIAGMVIAQSGTSLPHGMGYALTYFHNIPHGMANGVLLKSYLQFSENKHRVRKILYLLTIENLDELGDFLNDMLGSIDNVSYKDICSYAENMALNKDKLKNHPTPVGKEDILKIYKDSLNL